MHIGHGFALSLSSEYCRKNKGKLILRIEDTNPDNIDPIAYDKMPDEGKWVTKDNISETIIQSDRMDIYYKYAKTLFDMEALYVCTCDPEESKKLRNDKQACTCRELSKDDQIKRWNKMLDGTFKPGECVVRVKTDITHKNPAMRDFPVFRINDSKHPRQNNKYRVWPLMNMSVWVDDVEFGMTHIIRAKDHADNAKRQEYLYNYLKKPIPETVFVGKINFTGMPVSCSTTRKAIEEGKYSSWEDIRIPFLAPLRRRGFTPDAFIKYAESVGVSLNDKTVTKEEFFKTIDAFNKDVIDPVSKRFYFVWDPVDITVDGAPSMELEHDFHKDNEKGGRKFKTGTSFIITKEDFDGFNNGEMNRLMDCLNFNVSVNGYSFVDKDYMTFKEKGKKIIHWLPKDSGIKTEVLMPDNTITSGMIEENANVLKVGDVVQLERFGFCRLDSIDNDVYKFWFAHK